jgi:hypothetical protein
VPSYPQGILAWIAPANFWDFEGAGVKLVRIEEACYSKLGTLIRHRLKRERRTCTERTKSLIESADGRVATAATRQEKKLCPNRQTRNPLDPDRPSH